MDELELELAQRRLHSDIEQGLNLSHPFIRKECKGKNWRDQHWDDEKKEFIDDGVAKFSYCPNCKNYAWALGSICPTLYKKSLEQQLASISKKL